LVNVYAYSPIKAALHARHTETDRNSEINKQTDNMTNLTKREEKNKYSGYNESVSCVYVGNRTDTWNNEERNKSVLHFVGDAKSHNSIKSVKWLTHFVTRC